MVKISLPKEMLQKEAFKTLPAKEKDEYISNLLKKVLELNPEGITISQIREAAGLTYSTIWHHLEILSCTAQGHKRSHGNLDVYFPPGNAYHLNEVEQGKIHYAFSMIEGDKGKFVAIHEKRENRQGNQYIYGGISIPLNLIEDFIETLEKAKSHQFDKNQDSG